MSLHAYQYPDTWVFSDDCPAPPEDWIDTTEKIRLFLEMFLTRTFFNRAIVWKTRYLRYNKAFAVPPQSTCRIITCVEELKRIDRFVRLSCQGSGHMSILFVPLHPQAFAKEIIERKLYGHPQSMKIGTYKKGDPLDRNQGQHIEFLQSDIFNAGEHLFTFHHDAEYLYEIFR